MKIIITYSVIATALFLPFSHAHPERIQARADDDTKDNEEHIPIAKEWLDNDNRHVPQWRPAPPDPHTKHLTLCKTKPPAVADLDPAKDAGGAPLPSKDNCDLLLRPLGSTWLYFSNWTLEDAGPSPPKQPWIHAEASKCVFVVTGWHPPKDHGGKKLTVEVGNDDVKNLVRESLDRHAKSADGDYDRVGTKGSMDCGGTLVEWQLRKMECPMGKHSTSPTWCTEK
ncbi:hypothetical protein PG994_006368 [Apiospora phragmitis]|uniref:Ecp2 effector protein-like domain-containing protein n=1 Tax=Apiospora phragmitis TaxID=2905665 RepID=A0ABR1VEV2_9PEZI